MLNLNIASLIPFDLNDLNINKYLSIIAFMHYNFTGITTKEYSFPTKIAVVPFFI